MVIERVISTLYNAGCILGEAPFWHKLRQSCLWVDIEKCHLYEYQWNTGEIKKWKLSQRVSFIIEQSDGNVLLGVQGGIKTFNLDNGTMQWLKQVEVNHCDIRCNDGYCDISGRIWLGVMHVDAKPGAGALYCLYPDLEMYKMIGDMTIPNGIAWDTKTQRLYFVDSTRHQVRSYILDEVNHQLVLDKVVIQIPEKDGTPDGITLDCEGMLWIALYNGFSVIRCNPLNGAVLEVIRLPVPQVTNCCFAGPELRDLVITTARERMKVSELKEYPQSGDVFVVKDIGVTGIGNFKFNL